MNVPFKFRFLLRNIYQGFNRHGAIFPLVMFTRILQYVYVLIFGSKSFTFAGKEYHYFYHLENPTFRSERCVEVALAKDLVSRFDPQEVLEVGNVLANYGSYSHTVLDKYEKDRGVINEDVISYNPEHEFSCILSISTLEHVGWDEPEKQDDKIRVAIEHLRTLLKPGGILWFSVPVGYNDFLDADISKDFLGMQEYRFLKRTGKLPNWREVSYEDVKNDRYGDPYLNASSIMVAWDVKT